MAALPNLTAVSVQEYLNSSFPDGDREYLDGMVVERNVGTPGHSALQKILIVHLASFEKDLQIAVRRDLMCRVAGCFRLIAVSCWRYSMMNSRQNSENVIRSKAPEARRMGRVEKTCSLGSEEGLPLDKALAVADAIEDEELIRKHLR